MKEKISSKIQRAEYLMSYYLDILKVYEEIKEHWVYHLSVSKNNTCKFQTWKVAWVDKVFFETFPTMIENIIKEIEKELKEFILKQ